MNDALGQLLRTTELVYPLHYVQIVPPTRRPKVACDTPHWGLECDKKFSQSQLDVLFSLSSHEHARGGQYALKIRGRRFDSGLDPHMVDSTAEGSYAR